MVLYALFLHMTKNQAVLAAGCSYLGLIVWRQKFGLIWPPYMNTNNSIKLWSTLFWLPFTTVKPYSETRWTVNSFRFRIRFWVEEMVSVWPFLREMFAKVWNHSYITDLQLHIQNNYNMMLWLIGNMKRMNRGLYNSKKDRSVLSFIKYI